MGVAVLAHRRLSHAKHHRWAEKWHRKEPGFCRPLRNDCFIQLQAYAKIEPTGNHYRMTGLKLTLGKHKMMRKNARTEENMSVLGFTYLSTTVATDSGSTAEDYFSRNV